MQCDKERESSGYLERMLVDGAKPFLFRSRVRTLLGLPEWDGDNRIFSSPSLPVGFKYGKGLPQDGPFMGARYSLTRTGEGPVFVGPTSRHEVSEETDLNIFASGRTFPYEAEEIIRPRKFAGDDVFEDGVPKRDVLIRGTGFSGHQKSESHGNQAVSGLTSAHESLDTAPDMTRRTDMPIHGQDEQLPDTTTRIIQKPVVSPETGRGQLGRTPQPGFREAFSGNPVKESRGNDLAGNTKNRSDAVSDAPMGMETTTIEIPGSSRTTQNVSFFSLIEDAPRLKAEMRSTESIFRPLPESGFLGNTGVTTGGKGHPLADAHPGSEASVSMPSRFHGRDADEEGQTQPVPFGHSSVKGSDESRFETRGVKASEGPRSQEQFFRGPVALPPERMISHHIGDGEEAGGFHGAGSVHSGALERIEQIRRALREQITRTSAEPNGRDDEPVSQQLRTEAPPLPTPPVTAARPPTPQARVPRAFWQRRYLGHFHMRPLR
ncbi:MAG: hypothetical protein A4E65_03720 [Syntrophorhabdus sp. PtaU1.Bin153]|nr:MAG: hypothetical protein A4E65_03720 [Syntrophorhabdus sp. PtaU1.Bin153]